MNGKPEDHPKAPGMPGKPTPETHQPAHPAPAHPAPDVDDEMDMATALAMEAGAGVHNPEEEALYEFGHAAPLAEGEVVQGEVLQIIQTGVIVDFGFKQEGFVPLQQVTAPDGTITVNIGDKIEVMRDRRGTEVEGYVLLSHERASKRRAWENLEKAFREGLLISGRVMGRVKGGLSVDVGVGAFMPSTQVDVRPTHNLDPFIGQDIAVKVIKLNRRRDNVVVSRKSAIEEEYSHRKTSLLDTLSEGAIVTGVVKNLTDYGVFIDLGGIDGLLHVSDMSYGRVAHPSSMLNVGDEVTVKVLKFDREKERISLGLKQIAPDPWETVAERFPMGTRVVGRVVSTTDYGSFVEIEPGVEGLIHISEMTWSRRMKHPTKVVRVGDSVECVVLEVKPSDRRMSLGIKQLEADPWTTVDQRYSIGSVVEGRVRKLTDFGAFVEIEEGIDGLVHISDLTWTKRVQHPSEVVKKGQIVQAVILEIDAPNRRLSLGMKQLQPDAWETFFRAHQVGETVRGRVSRGVTFGVFVELAPGVEGLCHNSEIPPELKVSTPPLPVGTEWEFRIIKLVEAEKRIGLTALGPAHEDERQRLVGYKKSAGKPADSHSGEEEAPHPAAEAGENTVE